MDNTQLNPLTGLGGKFIYNFYDNIYVLNLISSKLSNAQYLQGKHIIGKDIEIIEFSSEEVVEECQVDILFGM